MRVIAGRLKGRQLKAPSGVQVRPTADRVKEALFSILGSHVVGARVLDLYAGTGALGIEALSRGAGAVTFVEHHPVAIHSLRDNIRTCGLTGQADVQTCRVETFVARARTGGAPYQILLADPPYQLAAEVAAWGARLPEELLAPDAVAAVEHARKMSPPHALGPLSLARTYEYGDTAVTIYRRPQPEAAA